MEAITLKPKELRKEYSAFIGEAKKWTIIQNDFKS